MFDYHLHTDLCKHASGTLEDYARRAVDMGLTEICFTDHIPLPGGFDADHRMGLDQVALYVDRVRKVRDRFPELTVLLGVEADFIDGGERFMESFLSEHPFDLVILSVHFIENWPPGHWVFAYDFPGKKLSQVYRDYLDALRRGVETGLFDVVGHLDLIKQPGRPVEAENPDDLDRLLDAVERAGMSVEINTSGRRKPIAECYPSPGIAGRVLGRAIPVTLGSDAHRPEQVGYGLAEWLDRIPAGRPVRLARYRNRRRTVLDGRRGWEEGQAETVILR